MRRPVYKKSLKQQMRENVTAMLGMATTQEQRDRIAKDFPLPEIKHRKPRMKPEGLSELQEQIRVIKWWDSVCHQYGLLPVHLFHIPNGGSRGTIEAVNLKRSGVRPGIPDLFLAIARDPFFGMFIEMKAEHGRLEAEQAETMQEFGKQRYQCVVAWSNLEAIEKIGQYLAGR